MSDQIPEFEAWWEVWRDANKDIVMLGETYYSALTAWREQQRIIDEQHAEIERLQAELDDYKRKIEVLGTLRVRAGGMALPEPTVIFTCAECGKQVK